MLSTLWSVIHERKHEGYRQFVGCLNHGEYNIVFIGGLLVELLAVARCRCSYRQPRGLCVQWLDSSAAKAVRAGSRYSDCQVTEEEEKDIDC